MTLDVADAGEPMDVPEGTALVLMSATLFKQWADQTEHTIVKWGAPMAWSGTIYAPTVTYCEEEHEHQA